MQAVYGLILLAVFSTASFAQALEDDGRGSTPPGAAQDGSRPSEGAITGGTIVPGESGGVPSAKAPPLQGVRRCNELTGTLRDQCLRQEEGASSGATVPEPASGKAPPPRIDPPPQNPG